MSPLFNKNKQNNSGNAVSIVKPIVLGIVAITFMLLFRDEIGKLLDRTTNVVVSSSGIEIKTTETPLGRTVFSGTSVQQSGTSLDGIQGSTYFSARFSFKMSWPNNIDWTANARDGAEVLQTMGFPPSLKMPLFLMRTQTVGNFRPNVNVLVEKVGDRVSIKEYMDLSVAGMLQQGWEIMSSDIDEATQGGFLTFVNTSSESEVYQFQRILISSGSAYVITASQLPPDDRLSQALKDELRGILNSFYLIL